MKKLLILLGCIFTSLVLNASESRVGFITQNGIHEKLASSWDQELSMDGGNLAFQIMNKVDDPELVLTIPQNNQSVWINPYTNKYEKVMDNSLIVKTNDGKYQLLVGLFYKGSKESKKMYKELIDLFGKKNVKIINNLLYSDTLKEDIYEIFKSKNEIKKDKHWGIVG